MNSFALAVQFLTRVPLRSGAATSHDVARSYYFYPLIGLCIGLAAVVVRHTFALIFPNSFSIVAVIAFLAWITGGLHEDGFADVADGMAGGWNAEQRLTIMKDSRVGAFGALALAIAVLAKYSALTSMNSLRIDGAIITAQILARWAFLKFGYFNPYAREGLGSEFMKRMDTNVVVLGAVFSAGTSVVLFKLQGLLAFGISCGTVGVASIYFRHKL